MKSLAILLVSALSALCAPIGFMEPTVPGLVGWWKMNDGSGTTAVDSSGYSNTLFLTNAPTWTNGVVMDGLMFKGASFQNGGVPYTPLIDLPNHALSASAWVKLDSLPNSYNSVISEESSSEGYTLLIKSTGKLAIYLSHSGTGVNYDGTGATTLTLNRWYHIAFTWTGGTLTGWVNGSTDNQVNGTWASTATSNPLRVANSFSPNRFLSGTLDDLRIYNRALATNEVVQLYNGGAGSQH